MGNILRNIMTKLLLPLSIVVGALAGGAGSAQSATDPGVARFTLTTDKAEVASGGTVSVGIGVEDAQNLYGFELSFAYDTTRFEVVEAGASTEFGTQGANAWVVQDDRGGVLRLVAVRLGRADGMSGDRLIATVRLKAKDVGGDAVLELKPGAAYSDYDETLFKMTEGVKKTVSVAGVAPNSGSPPPLGGFPIGIPTTGAGVAGGDGPAGTRLEYDSEWVAEQWKAGDAMTIDVPETEERLEIRLPYRALISGSPDGRLTVRSALGVYELPLAVLRQGTVVTSEDTRVVITMEQAEGAQQARMEQAASVAGAVLAAPGMDFQIAVVNGEASTVLDDFGNVYVERRLTIPGETAGSEVTGVWFDPEMSSFRFVPTRIGRSEDGFYAALRRPGNSWYAVASYEKSFADLSGHWAKSEVELLASKFILRGMKNELFAPDEPVTRAQFATMLVQALSLTEAPAFAAFKDVPPKAWYLGALGAAAKAGLISGYADGSFRADQEITRAEMAVIAARAADFVGEPLAPSDELSQFLDEAELPAWAKDAVGEVSRAGIMGGLTAQRFDGQGTTTRAQAAVVLKRLLEKVGFL